MQRYLKTLFLLVSMLLYSCSTSNAVVIESSMDTNTVDAQDEEIIEC